jgi:hypothetical protein
MASLLDVAGGDWRRYRPVSRFTLRITFLLLQRRLIGKLFHYKMAVFWVVASCRLVRVYQCFSGLYCFHHQDDETSETLMNSYQSTRRYNPEDSHLHSHRRENLKSNPFHYSCKPEENLLLYYLT